MAKTPKTEAGSLTATNAGTVRTALVIIAVIVAGAAIHWLGGILTPLALAIFLMLMIGSFTRFLTARFPFLPGWAATATALASLVAAFLVSSWIIAEYATGFVDQLSGYAPRLNGLIARLAERSGIAVPPTVDQIFESLNPVRYLGLVAQGFQTFLANAAFVLIYLGFLIASRVGFQRKWVMLFPNRDERHNAVLVLERIKIGVERYLWVQTVTGLMIALASWAVMAAVGLENAFFWAFLIFVVGYIPVIGPLIAGLIPPVFALVQFDSFLPAIILLVALNAINIVVGNLILPKMQGESLNLDPVVVLLSLAFWGAIWGAAGMFLSTPLTVATMVVLAQFEGGRWIAVLMSGDGNPLNESKAQQKQSAVEN